MDHKIYMRDDYLRNAFDMFDKDGSGKLDKEEIKAILGGDDMKDIEMDETIEACIKRVDENGDGELDFQEFITMMANIKDCEACEVK